MLGFFMGPHHMATKKSAPAEQLPLISGMPFVRADKNGDFIIDIQVMPNAAKRRLMDFMTRVDRPVWSH